MRKLILLSLCTLASLSGSSAHAQSSLLPPPPNYLAGDEVVVLIEGKSTQLNCEGSCRIVAIGNEEIIDCKGPACPKKPDAAVDLNEVQLKTCELTLTPKPNVRYGFTNLIMRTTRNSVHRKLEIRTTRDPAAVKRYQPKINICE